MRDRSRSDDRTELPEWPEQVIGGKYVRLLERQLNQLRHEPAHGNRTLHLDDVFVTHLLAFFNPTVRSLRTIEDFSQTRQVQKHVSLRKLCRSTLSDFHRLVDPERLEPILAALRGQLSQKAVIRPGAESDLATLLKQTIAVDGTFLPAAADVAWAVCNTNNHGSRRHRARVDCQVEVETWLPEVITVPEPGQSEADSAQPLLKSGCIYLYDRGFQSFALLNAHFTQQEEGQHVPHAYFVARYRPAGGNSPELQEAVERERTPQDRAAGVVSDRTGRFHSSKQCRHRIDPVPLREVRVEYEQQGEMKTLRLITNLYDVPAAIIAHLYRYRWQVELFFRWLKCCGNFNHLLSHSRDGVLMHFYVTIIATLLMYLHTGYRPSKYCFVLLSQVAVGATTLDEVLPILRERERQCQLAREAAQRRLAKKQA